MPVGIHDQDQQDTKDGIGGQVEWQAEVVLDLERDRLRRIVDQHLRDAADHRAHQRADATDHQADQELDR